MKRGPLLLLIIAFCLLGQFLMGVLPSDGSLLSVMLAGLVFAIIVAPLFLWYYSLGLFLHEMLPQEIKFSLRKFKLLSRAFYVYQTLFGMYVIGSSMNISLGLSSGMVTLIFVLVAFLHMFMIVALFYILSFIAKALLAVELGKDVVFKDFSKEFFLLWLSVIGIWILQPRINVLVKQKA